MTSESGPVTKDLGKVAKQLQDTVSTLTGKRTPLILLYFDESHDLHEPLSKDQKAPSRYHALLWALEALSSVRTMFSLFLSTNSKLREFAPSKHFLNSKRWRNSDGLVPPYTELMFDCHPSLSTTSKGVTLERSGEIDFMSWFGRPLCVNTFFTMLRRCLILAGPIKQVLESL